MIQKDGRDMTRLLGDVTAVLMARMPEPGHVKTRLVSGGVYSRAMAADLAWAMLRCTAQRLSALGRLVLAVSPDRGRLRPDGRFLGDLDIPDGMQLGPQPYISRDLIVARFQDDAGTPMVKRYRLVLP